MNSAQNLKTKIKVRWSEHWDRCQKCGTTKNKYGGLGLCITCYAELYNRRTDGEFDKWRQKMKKGKLKIRRWSREYDYCQKCGKSEKPYRARGLCRSCYQIAYQKILRQQRRSLKLKGRKLKPCNICGKTILMKPGQAFCHDCANSDQVRFGASLPSIPTYIRRKIG